VVKKGGGGGGKRKKKRGGGEELFCGWTLIYTLNVFPSNQNHLSREGGGKGTKNGVKWCTGGRGGGENERKKKNRKKKKKKKRVPNLLPAPKKKGPWYPVGGLGKKKE